MQNSYSKILVGITQRIDKIQDRDEVRDALDQRLVEWLMQAGYLSVAIPNNLININKSNKFVSESTLKKWLDVTEPGAILLSGGNNIGEFPERDATERYLLSWAKINKIPVLGICRGLQMMAVWGGVELKHVKGHVCERHIITGDIRKEVNSFHDYAPANCPQGFSVISECTDGVIEAIRHNRNPWEGWMWHPEREQEFDTDDIERLRNLFL